MTDVMFYQLMDQPLEGALVTLVEKSRQRGWNVVVQSGQQQSLENINQRLWTYRDESFLPHGMDGDNHAEHQPIWLTTSPDNPNKSAIRFLIDQADHNDLGHYERAVYMFDGLDNDALAHARSRWKAEKAAGHSVTYWQQTPQGGWEKKA